MERMRRVGWMLAMALAAARAASGVEDAALPAPANAQATTPDAAQQPALARARRLVAEGRYADAVTAARAAVTEAEREAGADSVAAAAALDVLVGALLHAGEGAEPDTRAVAERAVAIREKTSSADDTALAASLGNLARVIESAGDLEAARPLHERALAIREKALGPDHADVASSLGSLGSLLHAAGDLEAARPLLERSLAIADKALGPEHPDVASSLTSLANVLQDAGDLAGARPLHERALRLLETTRGPDHPDVAAAMNNLAQLLHQSGDLRAAQPLYERALATWEKALGPDHPNVAVALGNLAGLLGDAGDLRAARPLHERALAITEKAFGPDHVAVAGSLNNLGLLVANMGDLRAALPLLERCLAIAERALGPDHPHVASTLNNIASIHGALGNLGGARPLLERALAIKEKVRGPDHPSVATSLVTLAGLLQDAGDLSGARSLYERALVIREKALGPDHPDLASDLTSMATLLQAMGELESARRIAERAVAINEKALGADSPAVATSLNNLGGTLLASGDPSGARPLFERALAMTEKALGPDHLDVATGLNNLAFLLEAEGDRRGARPLLERSLAIREKSLGPDHPLVAMAINNLASRLQDEGDFGGARPLYERALAINEKALGPDHPDVAQAVNNLASLTEAVGDLRGARPLYERAIAIDEKALGPDHPDVARSVNSLARILAALGERPAAMELALRSETVGREHALRTLRSLAERQALAHAAKRPGGLGTAVSLATSGVDAGARARAWDAVVRARALVLDEMGARRHRADDAAAAADAKVAERARALASASQRLANLTVRGPGPLPPDEYRRLREEAARETEQAERGLAELSASFSRDRARAATGFDDVARALAPGDALIAYCRHWHVRVATRPEEVPLAGVPAPRRELAYSAFVLRGGEREPEAVALGDAGGIETLVEQWRAAVSRASSGVAPAALAAGQALRRAAWDPVRPHLRDARRVFVVPDGALHLVNHAALPDDEGAFLLESGPVLHYLSAERDLVHAGAADRRGGTLLAAGGPDFDATDLFASLASRPVAARATPIAQVASLSSFRGPRASCAELAELRFSALPEAAAEARDVARVWREHAGGAEPSRAITVLSAAAASEAAFKENAPGRRVLHLATHGFFLGDRCESAPNATRGVGSASTERERSSAAAENPLLLAGLAFAGANHRDAAAPDEEDGILTAQEVASLDLSGCEWAVPSACGTALGDVRSGEGVLGLERAFRAAGARTVIKSLWSVDDAATRAWMKELYDARLERKLGTAECVREASLAVLRERRARGEDDSPFWWGAFVASGDWR